MKKIYGWNYYCEKILRKNESYIENSLEIKEKSYVSFEMRDRGKVREIHQVDRESGLYQLQNNLNKNLLSRIPLSKAAVGFVKGKSYQEYLRPHCGKRFHMRLDIRHFFDNVTEEQVVKSLEEFVQDEEIRINIGQITTLNGCLPQGAVTSPAMSNIVFRQIDQRILKYCQAIRTVKKERNIEYDDIIYTRYADDMMFSSDYLDFRKKLSFYKMIKYILLENGFHLNYDKTLKLFFVKDGEDVLLAVEDNGPGMEQEEADKLVTYKASGYGLKNVNDRMQLLYGMEYGIKVFSQIDQGTRVEMRIPREKADEEAVAAGEFSTKKFLQEPEEDTEDTTGKKGGKSEEKK